MRRCLENVIKETMMCDYTKQDFYLKKILLFCVQICFFATTVISLHGCLNVNLKSVLPNQIYYSLDAIALESQCKNPTSRLALNVSVLSPFDGKDILVYNKKTEITILETYKWIDLPKNMIRNAFLKVALNHCMQVEQNPSITQKIKTLRLNINELYVKIQNDTNNAHIYLNYEVIGHDMNRIKSGIVTSNMQDTNPAKALQDTVSDALNKVALQIKNVN